MRVSDLLWFVAHTRPRCEKKLLQFCEREGLSASLPCYRAAHKYRGKTVVFQKPLFPGYVFLQISPEQRGKIHRSDYVANLLDVVDQELFTHQLRTCCARWRLILRYVWRPRSEKACESRSKMGPCAEWKPGWNN